MMKRDIQYYVKVKNMIPFITELDILHIITYVFSNYYEKNKVDLYNSLPLENTMTFIML